MSKFVYTLLFAGLALVMTGCGTAPVNGSDTGTGIGTSQVERGVDDRSITAAVKAAFAEDDLLGSQRIEVETEEGVVSLDARLDSGRAANRAVSLARSVPGVQRVVWSRLDLAP